MKKTVVALFIGTLFAAAHAAPMTEDEKTLYTVGQMLGQQLSVFSMSAAELEAVKSGLSDAVNGKKAAVDAEAYGPKVQTLVQSRRAAGAAKQAAAGKVFADKAAKEAGAVKTPSGLVYISQKEGSGAHPAATDVVKVHYKGTLIDGKEFDSSYKRNEAAEFPLNGVIKCWTEGLQKMKVGGKARLVCPASIAYGENSPPSIPPGSTLNFEVELLAINKPEAPKEPAKEAPKAAK